MSADATPAIAMNDLSRSWLATSPEAAEMVARVLASGRYLLGGETAAFERELADYLGARETVAVASGTDALVLAMLGAGVHTGSEVVLAANAGGYAATAAAQIGANVVFADVHPDSACLTLESVDSVIGSQTRAVVVTHLYGNLADAEAIALAYRDRGVVLIEDCAQAIGLRSGGTRAGSIGDVAALSFYPTKNLGAAGDGGAVATSDAGIAERVRRLRQYGWSERYRVELSGGRNSRMDEIQAALLRHGLTQLESRNARRLAILGHYRSTADHLRWVTGSVPTVAHLAVFRTTDRPSVRQRLTASGVGTDVHYPIPDHLQSGLARPARATTLVETESLADEIVTVPCYPELTDPEVEHIARSLAGLP